jgi:hypothetical protein
MFRRSGVSVSRAAPAALAAGLALLASRAGARPMDPDLSHLVVDPSCTSSADATCVADRAGYTKLVSQLGFALAPNSVHPARTNGLAGFDVSLLASLTRIDASADYWRRGTEGQSTAGAAPGNTDPASFLQLYAVELRKGFGFGIEAAASLGVMPDTSLLSWGADVRVALLEGLRYGAFRYLPDTSVGASLRHATGLGELSLSTLALDARLSHPFVFASGFIITPWLGYQWLRISADSELVDLTPGVNALRECGYVGTNSPGSVGIPETEGAVPASGAPVGTLDGAPLCSGGSGADFASSAAFGEATVLRHRAVLGASYRRELLNVGAQLVTDLVSPDDAQSDEDVARALRCDESGQSCRAAPRQWSLTLQLGASF